MGKKCKKSIKSRKNDKQLEKIDLKYEETAKKLVENYGKFRKYKNRSKIIKKIFENRGKMR